MSTIKRNQFLQQNQNRSIDLRKLEGEAAHSLRDAGSSIDQIARADINGDGKIEGERELKQLFRHMDSFDRNGSGRSFIAKREDGSLTSAGQIKQALDGVFEEAGTASNTAQTITLGDFLTQTQHQALNLDKVEGVDAELRSVGSSARQVARADLNNDGKIEGEQELKELFRHMDSMDRNGSARSFTAKRPNGQLTASGKTYNTLSLLFAEASQNTPINSTQNTTHHSATELGRLFAEGGAKSLETKMTGHLKSIEETGVGIYYGDHSSLQSMSRKERQEWIDANATPGTQPPSASELKKSSCIDWAMDNLEAAYAAAGKSERWQEIKKTVHRQGSKGTDLAIELQKDGWEAIYWNPDSRKAEDGNNEHTYTAAITKRGKPYYGIQIDHRVTDYRPASGSTTQLDHSNLEKLRKVPFFFGLAKGGMHTFVGRDGKVNEFHWTAKPDDSNAIEERALEDFPWLSGAIMVPPGTWVD